MFTPAVLPAMATSFLNWHHFVDPYVKNKQIWVCPSANLPILNIYGSLVCHYGFTNSLLSQ